MLLRVLGVAAILTYFSALGCALLESTPAPSTRAATSTSLPTSIAFEGKPFRAVVMQLQRIDYMDQYKRSIDEIVALGADTVKFAVDARQENGSSSRIYIDQRFSPSSDQLIDLMRYAKGKNLRVILMPMVLLDKPRGNEWRGQIKPERWDVWWESYRELLGHFGWIATAGGVDVLVVGTELVSTEPMLDEWRETIRRVRLGFKGYLTYSANWDHYEGIGFWDDLDFIGMNSYWTLGEDADVSVEQIVANWRPIQQRVLSFAASKNKPLLLLEVGWCSLGNAAKEPWDYTKTEEPIDDELQRKLWVGFMQVWYGAPGLAGFAVWEWPPSAGGKDADEGPRRGYTPENKPAQGVIKEWFAKEWKQ